MSHQFQVGKTYRNRNGQYVVEAIEGNQMKIRYVEGGTLVTDVDIQSRIWENIQFEEQMARTEARRQQAQEARAAARRRSARARRERARPRFDGFEKDDFDTSGRGIAWSGRRDLGRLLAYELSRQDRGSFGHWIVPYQSEVHVGRKKVYDKANRELNAALFVATSEDGVSYGFHIGKPSGKARPNWPWSAVTTALVEQAPLREKLRKAMAKHDLTMTVYATEARYEQVARITVEKDDFVWQHADEDQEIRREMTARQLAEYLQELAPKKRSDIYIGRWLPAAEAVKGGKGLVGEIFGVCQALLPVYDASVAK
ncbi:MAG: hypothetical protein PVF47_12240 [Anaerolineae bacterium]|jgi:hypothetical protein